MCELCVFLISGIDLVPSDDRMVYYGILVSFPRTVPMAQLHLPWQKVKCYRIIYKPNNKCLFLVPSTLHQN